MITLDRRKFLQTTAAGAALMAAPSAFAQTPKKGGTLRVGKGHGQTSDTLDPGSWENGFMIAVGFGIHNYLTEVHADGTVTGEVAEGWEASDDAKSWTFKIRDMTFHNGNPVTSADVIASINHHLGDDSKSAAKPIVGPIVGMKADGDKVVVFELEAGNADFPYIVSDYHLPIIPAKDDSIDWVSGVGCGAYTLESFEPGVRADFKKFDGYWKSDRGHFDAVEMIAVVDSAARTNGLMTNEFDVIDKVDLKTVALLKRRPGLTVHSIAGTQHYTYAMHTNAAPFSDNNVRMALKHAVNRQELVDKILQGYGVVGNDHPIGPGQRYFASDLPQRSYDPDKAKFYMKEAGLTSLDVDLSVADAAYGGAVDAGVLYSESAKAAGININVVREPNDGYWSNVWLKKPFCAVYWSGRPTEDWMFATAYEKGVAWNDTYWEHERFNELLQQGRAELNDDLRREIYTEMQTILADEGGTIIPMFASYVFAVSDKMGHGEIASNWDMDGERWMERWWFT